MQWCAVLWTPQASPGLSFVRVAEWVLLVRDLIRDDPRRGVRDMHADAAAPCQH